MNALESIKSVITSACVGAYYGDAAVDHVVVVPDYVSGSDFDNNDLYEDEHFNIEIFCSGDYRTTVSNYCTLLKPLGFVIESKEYIEFINETKQHHYCIGVVFRTYI